MRCSVLCGTVSVRALNATAAISSAETKGIFPSSVAEMILSWSRIVDRCPASDKFSNSY